MSHFKLSTEIIKLSVSDYWDVAKLEWVIEDIYFADEPEVCLCGHQDIIECCVIRNIHNDNQVIVGNVCVNKFLGIDSDKLFNAVKRVRKDSTKSLNAESIEYAHGKGWINDWERDFYFDTLRKRSMSEKQIAKRKQINEKIAANIAAYNQ